MFVNLAPIKKKLYLYVDVFNRLNYVKSLCCLFYCVFCHLFLHNLLTITFLCNLICWSSICLDCLFTRICVLMVPICCVNLKIEGITPWRQSRFW